MNRRTFVHPVLFALAPVVSLYAHNVMRARVSDTFLPAALMVALGIVVFGAAWLAVHSPVKPALVASYALLLFASYGPVSNSLNTRVVLGIAVARPTVLVVIWTILFAAGTVAIMRAHGSLAAPNSIALVVGLGLLVVPLWNIIQFEVTANRAATTTNCAYHDDEVYVTARPSPAPDIYFICMDRYARDSSLQDWFGYDNSAFTSFLSSRGFYVADRSFSNYIMTLQSLSATLNMQYIDCLTALMGEESRNRLPLFYMLKDYRVWHVLKARGYQFVHAGTRFHVTARNPNADVNYNVEQLPEFTQMFLETTIAFPVLNKLGVLDDGRVEKVKRVEHNLAMLEALPEIDQPRFVFAHFLLPHEPYVFDENGNFCDSDHEYARTREENYVAQLRYTNKCLENLIDVVLARSRTPPVIILQADEGPYPDGTKAASFRWDTATAGQCREKTHILNAIYLPGADSTAFYPSMTPVNTFRLVFNHVFGTRYEMLPDECWAYQDLHHLYRFIDITDRVR